MVVPRRGGGGVHDASVVCMGASILSKGGVWGGVCGDVYVFVRRGWGGWGCMLVPQCVFVARMLSSVCVRLCVCVCVCV
jgi:hypothetical protein